MLDRCEPPVRLGFRHERASASWGYSLWLESLTKTGAAITAIDPKPGTNDFARFAEDVVFSPLAVMGNPRVTGVDVRFETKELDSTD
jgi:hypothetical protein